MSIAAMRIQFSASECVPHAFSFSNIENGFLELFFATLATHMTGPKGWRKFF
jgi:hypothetical protein